MAIEKGLPIEPNGATSYYLRHIAQGKRKVEITELAHAALLFGSDKDALADGVGIVISKENSSALQRLRVEGLKRYRLLICFGKSLTRFPVLSCLGRFASLSSPRTNRTDPHPWHTGF